MKNINLPWVIDEKTNEPSVSLTLLMTTFLMAAVAAILHLAKVTDNTSVCTELFYATLALYFGRRYQSGKGGVVDAPEKESKP